MKFIDLHCDTINKLMDNVDAYKLYKNNFSIDIEKLQKGDCLAQTFALFVDSHTVKNPYEYCISMSNKFYEELEKNKEYISLATNYEQIISNYKSSKLTALLSIEEGAVLQGEIKNVDKFYNIGVRIMTLSWNHENELCFPHLDKNTNNIGLKEFGREVVCKMNEIGMIIDVSHISDCGFYDVAEISEKPFIASHSDARSLCDNSRNLTDDMIKVLSNCGGIIGINFFHKFLSNRKDKNSRIEDIVRHIKYIYNVGGIDVLAIGTDFDGIVSNTEIKDVSEMNKLCEPLKKAGFSDDQIEKIFYKNVLRVIKEVM